jgi:hypothetical protein
VVVWPADVATAAPRFPTPAWGERGEMRAKRKAEGLP